MRSIRDLSSGVSGAREANVQLLRELEGMSDLLGAANERQLALKNRVALLEQTLERAHVEASRERAYILDQQDAFIVALMEDHEQVIAELHRELDSMRLRSTQRPGPLSADPDSDPAASSELTAREELEAARKLIDKLVGDRERTRETLLKVQAQRDEAQAALVELAKDHLKPQQARITDAVRQALPAAVQNATRNAPTLPPPDAAARASHAPHAPPISAPLPAVLTGIPPEDRASRAPAPQASVRPKAPELEFTPREQQEHLSQPPEELRAAVHSPASSPRPFEKRSFTPPGPPSLVPQQAPGTSSGRPGGYSLTNSVAPEHVSGAPRVSRAPRS
ncbi:MAG TPA: hypothetical protein VGQ57_22010 [Polyangiaceae bacterium]|jgi:hypothetical protein|nr:hypothetical protein [Polyangiaceae bacterium]